MKKDYEIKIDEAVRDLHYVGEDNVITIYADRGDSGEFLQETVYENRDSKELENIVRDKIWESHDDTIWQYEDEILKKAGFDVLDPEKEEPRDYLRNTYSIEPDYDHFLGHEMKVNIMLRTDNERNNEYTTIHEQYVAMVEPDALTQPHKVLKEDSMLVWLLKQQGHSLDELQATMKDYNKFFYDASYPNGNHVKHYGEDGKEPLAEKYIPDLKSQMLEKWSLHFSISERTALDDVIKTCSEMSKNGNRDFGEKSSIDKEER